MFNGKRLSGWMALAVFATVGGAMVAADPAFAKVDVDKLTIGGEVRERYEIRTNAAMRIAGATGLSAKGNESSASHRVRVNVGYDLTPDVAFFAQIQDARFFGTECAQGGGAATGAAGSACVSTANGNSNGVDLHQGYLQLKNVLIPGLSIKAGRQEIIFGDHRLFGNFGWSQIGNSFDAVRLTHSTDKADVDLFWARIVDNFANTQGTAAGTGQAPSVLFPGATGTAATAGGQATLSQDVYGLYVTLKPVKSWTIEPYYFLLTDSRNPANTSINTAQTPGQNRSFLGGRVNGKAGSGVVMDFTYEGNYQFGSIASTCSRSFGSGCGTFAGAPGVGGVTPATITGYRDARINASQHAVKTGFTFEAVPMKPRIGYEFDYASGDKCANFGTGTAATTTGDNNNCGGGHGTYTGADNLYPTNHFHYGYMDLQSWRNMVLHQVVFDVKPSPVSKFQINFSWLRLANTADNWYRANQAIYFASKATNQAASLGQELDLHYWHTFKEKFKFEIGYGHFFTGEYLAKSTGGVAGQACGTCPGFQNTQGTTTGFTGAVGDQTKDQDWGYIMGSILF